MKDILPGGRANKKKISPSKVNPHQLAMGIKIEKEHIDNPKVNKEIALDHLAEMPDYYTRLKKMEKKSYYEMGFEETLKALGII